MLLPYISKPLRIPRPPFSWERVPSIYSIASPTDPCGKNSTLADLALFVPRNSRAAIAAPISALLRLGPDGDFRSTEFAPTARAAGLEIIAWTAERSGRIRDGQVEAIFSDWAATVTFYANYFGLN